VFQAIESFIFVVRRWLDAARNAPLDGITPMSIYVCFVMSRIRSVAG
jgi:hypothetical protein